MQEEFSLAAGRYWGGVGSAPCCYSRERVSECEKLGYADRPTVALLSGPWAELGPCRFEKGVTFMSERGPDNICGGRGVPDEKPADPDAVLWRHWHCDDGACGGHWSPFVIRKRTERFVYVDPSPSARGETTVRLDRKKLESEGTASSKTYHEEFWTTAKMERTIAEDHKDSIE
jgi:hypothetical protein